MSNLLLNETPLVVLPSLACAVGVNEAIVLQQLHYWLQRSGNEQDGRRWVYNTLDQWQEQFPFWSADTIWRIFGSLRKAGVVLAENRNATTYKRMLWYAIDYDRLEELGCAISRNREMDIAESRNAFRENAESISQNREIDFAESRNIYKETEITTETTTETTTEDAAPPAPKRTPVEVYVDVTRCRLNNVQKDMIDYEVRDTVRWEQVIRQWMGKGYRPTSVDKLLAVYRDGWYEQGKAAPVKEKDLGSGKDWLVSHGYLSAIIQGAPVLSADEITF